MMMQLRREGLFSIMFLILYLMALAFGSQIVQAKEFPTKPVIIVIPVGPGGSHDLTARALVSAAMDYLGQPMFVQLKPGGGGAIGHDYVAKAPADGYTLLFTNPGAASTLPAIVGRSKGPESFDTVCRINYSPVLIAARPEAPFKTFKEMIAWAKGHPGELVFGTSGPWGPYDLPWRQIMHKTGITSRVVPFDGGGPCLVALLGGHVQAAGGLTAHTGPHIKAGTLRPLVVLDDKRDPYLPDVPTAKEEGVDVTYHIWRGFLVPKGTPRPIIDKLASVLKEMAYDKSVKKMINKLGDDIEYLGPDEFAKYWQAEYESHKEIGKILGKK